eukprot:CAMPEP_0174849414 /NCGR_PEP_ID=MMETSP1114-20130205/15654_1 /TAXON_ID=312471 /ORGANISM="Neobodo designis, Strain CCAP 1951/1" /LENGTH=455 /DNA_ID=CAMNT_0016083753 /DNA_START=39 /DNA_END=1406 /DNA_ORIENTATION=+
MRALTIAAVAMLAMAAMAQTVVDVTDATFDEVIQGEFVLMEFYAPWCGHCKKLEPEYAEAAKQIGDMAVLAKLDATVEKAAAQKYEIQGFPTIKVFRKGTLSGDYNGGRSAADFVKYVKGNSGPAVKAAANAAELDAMKKENDVVVVLSVAAVGGDAFEAFEKVANSMRGDVAFAVVTDASLLGGKTDAITLFRNFDEPEEAFDGEITDVAAVTSFVKDASVPLFDQIGPHNYKMYLDRKLPIVWVFAAESDVAAREAGKLSAPGFKGKLSFVWIDSSKYGQMAQRLGLKGDKFPAIAIDNEGKHFAMPDGDITQESLTAFVTDYVEGKLVATVRTEEAPEPHTVEGMTTVVGSTFDELVMDADTDVFIEFYAPWCGHCKQLAPVLDSLAKAHADKPVRIAKIDATANDFPQDAFPVQGFPTMFFVPKATHKPEQYEGGRSEEDFTNFLASKISA